VFIVAAVLLAVAVTCLLNQWPAMAWLLTAAGNTITLATLCALVWAILAIPLEALALVFPRAFCQAVMDHAAWLSSTLDL
jgi:hypothetical protein